MLRQTIEALRAPYSYKNAHQKALDVHSLKGDVLLLDVVRSLETQLHNRGFLPFSESFHPLWFIAETERNIFLWRNGLSLSNASNFEFWIDVPKLIKKRKEQLAESNPNNPFKNAGWGVDLESSTDSKAELLYLETLEEILAQLGPHAAAVSLLGATISEECAVRESIATRVVLPFTQTKESRSVES